MHGFGYNGVVGKGKIAYFSSKYLLQLPKFATCPRDELQQALTIMNSTPSIDSKTHRATIQDTSPSSHQGRRAACDRCRGQKLRCNREDQNGNAILSGKCTRCTKARATCISSTIVRFGRSNTTSNIDRRGKQKPGQDEPRTKASNTCRHGPHAMHNNHQNFGREKEPNNMSFDDEEAEVDTRHRASSADELGFGPWNPPSMHGNTPFGTYRGSAGADIAGVDGDMTTYDDGEDLANLESFDPDYNWSFIQLSALPKDTSILSTSSPSKGDRQTFHVDSRQNRSFSNEPQMSESPPSTGSTTAVFDPASTNFDSQVGTTRDTGEREEGSINFILRKLNESGAGGRPSSEEDILVPSDNEAQHWRMQQLSELTMSLYSLITTNSQPQNSQSTPTNTQSPLANNLLDRFVGSVLQTSTAFLKVLASFHPPTSSTQTLTRYSVLGSADSDTSASDSTSVFSDFTSNISTQKMWSRQDSSIRKQHSIGNSGASSGSKDNSPPSKPISADMTTALQLLTCYIHIIHLHSILYARILDHLLASLPPRNHDNPRNSATDSQQQHELPPIFPGMQVGGVCLDAFRVFQVKLILQISTHVLGEIEMALGLPDGFRISRKTPGTTGVLEMSVSVQFIEVTMREIGTSMRRTDGGDSEMGLGVEEERANSIRENLAIMRRLLKGTIDV